MSKETFCVFGGAGYIGSRLTQKLLEEGYKVKCVDNLHKGHADHLFNIINHPNYEFVYGDICDLNDCISGVAESDFIVNLAGIVGFPACKKHRILSEAVNVVGAENVVKARDQVFSHRKVPDIPPVFYASTGSIYGSLTELCTEDSPKNPQSIYGMDKYEGEKRTLSYDRTLSYRFATCFGVSPCMRVNLLVNDLVYQAMVNRHINIFQADFARTFIHIDDFCDSIIHGLTHINELNHNMYNMGDDSMNWSKRELAEFIKEHTGCAVTYNDTHTDADMRDYTVSYKRINDEGWYTKTTMEQGILELIEAVPLMRMRNPYE